MCKNSKIGGSPGWFEYLSKVTPPDWISSGQCQIIICLSLALLSLCFYNCFRSTGSDRFTAGRNRGAFGSVKVAGNNQGNIATGASCNSFGSLSLPFRKDSALSELQPSWGFLSDILLCVPRYTEQCQEQPCRGRIFLSRLLPI
jgi:hypothetical protein